MSIGAEVVQSKYVLVGKYFYTTKRYRTVQNGYYILKGFSFLFSRQKAKPCFGRVIFYSQTAGK